ncbi:hypothetical protein IQ249_11870 [Lusitaniella coriacea LEGE 07157]|uniref:Uncharacterized protein n=1 Tax=Lusitaniella coriacea LEGE 07157 TaxID=945747 RepID=A0A8J7IT40_9CYAN|nr:hypothetical protein [Lusitaniella coriacea]MBE9116597.1 hypothetical protein [Lusitaniella coriacea LEGE 07157]
MANLEPAPSSKKTNVWKWVGLGCGGALLFAIAAIGGFAYFVARNFGVSANPQEVEESAQQIFDYNIPGGSQGLFKMNPMGIEFALVADTKAQPEVLLSVGSIPPEISKEEPNAGESFLEGFQEPLEQSINNKTSQGFEFTEEKIEEKSLCEQTVSVTVREGTMSDSDSEGVPAINYLAVVQHNNSERFVSLITTGTQAKETAQTVFDSLKCK